MKTKEMGARSAVYLLGVILLGAGISLNTEAALGVSPVISIAYNLSQILHISIGTMSFLYYCFLIVLQFLLLGKKAELLLLMQVLAGFFTSIFIQLFDNVLRVPEEMSMRLIFLLLAIFLTGLGASLTIVMRLIPNPADALAKTIGDILRKDFGFGKNLLDATCLVIALIISFSFGKGFLGIGVGSIVAVVLTGRVVALCHPYSEEIYQLIENRGRENSPPLSSIFSYGLNVKYHQ
ncbi:MULTISPECIES: DUF6198 family protein [unclassified Streptococcus]|uniref:YczE/YyaS/YitT family protein n=1 Tax=unclassified Streptococcus TaxID=2608887 RepID=UPI000B30ABE1|nr:MULTISPECIES: DUF6198 family protein [unclassified Streptococcus]